MKRIYYIVELANEGYYSLFYGALCPTIYIQYATQFSSIGLVERLMLLEGIEHYTIMKIVDDKVERDFNITK